MASNFDPSKETWDEYVRRTQQAGFGGGSGGGGQGGGGVAVATGDGNHPSTSTASDGATVLTSELEQYEADIAARRDPTLAMMQQIIDLAKDTDARNQKAIEDFIGTSIPELQKQVDAANSGDQEALSELRGTYEGFSELEAPEYGGDAASSSADKQRQLDAYGQLGDVANRYKALTDPNLTAAERYNMELARLEEEQSRRAATEAALSELGARGARSGGAEIAAHLGSQQITSQNRALQDLGALAQAQERSMTALEGYGRTTGQMSDAAGGIREANDTMTRFNKEQKNLWDQWSADFRAEQQNQAAGRARDLFDADQITNDTAYGRHRDVYEANRDATAMKTGQYSAGADAIKSAIEGAIGINEARRAEASLKKKRTWRDDLKTIADPAGIF